MDSKLKELAVAVIELNEAQVNEKVNELLKKEVSALDIVMALQEGMTEVGELFSKGDYFLSELIVAGEIIKKVIADLESSLVGTQTITKGTVVIGTVKDDIHDLGKNIVVNLLKGAGYQVVDLGVDVAKEKFVEALKDTGAPLVGLSALLTTCQGNLKEAIDEIKAAGLTHVKVMIGGNYIDERVKEYCGADYFGDRADVAVKVAKEVFSQ